MEWFIIVRLVRKFRLVVSLTFGFCFLFCWILFLNSSQISTYEVVDFGNYRKNAQKLHQKSKLPMLMEVKSVKQGRFLESVDGTANGSLCSILIWITDIIQVQEDWPEEGDVFGSCTITYEQKLLKKARAVVFHQSVAEDALPWKKHRRAHQVFIWWSDLNPWVLKHYFSEDLKQFAGFFNWTMTHRRDSDVVFPQFTIELLYKSLESNGEDLATILHQKSKSAVWYVNDCLPTKGNHQRMKLADELVKAGLEVDSLGNCFASNQSLRDLRPYRFYLAFTDGYHCRDFVSGQLWIPLLNGLIPIVYGPTFRDVSRIAPRGSFIHVDRFESVTALVAYLKTVESDHAEYTKYFRWRERGPRATQLVTTGWLRLSNMLRQASETNEPRTIRKQIDDLGHFVFDEENSECMSLD